MIGKYIAKIGTDNIVEQVICVKSRIIRNEDGTINQSKVDEIGQAHLGAGTYGICRGASAPLRTTLWEVAPLHGKSLRSIS